MTGRKVDYPAIRAAQLDGHERVQRAARGRRLWQRPRRRWDGKVDYPADPGCSSSTDTNEYNAPPAAAACGNGLDDDADGKVDYPADPGCKSLSDNNESRSRPVRRRRVAGPVVPPWCQLDITPITVRTLDTGV